MAIPMPRLRHEPATGRDEARPRLQNGPDSGLDGRTPGRSPLPRAARGTPLAVMRTPADEEPETFEDRRNGAAGLGIP
jgi:hypothetical protein